MILKKKIFYAKESEYADQVNVLDSIREMLTKMGEPGTWESVTETINNATKYTNTDSEIYKGYKPQELMEPGLNLSENLKQLKIDIMDILNDIHSYIEAADENNDGDIPYGGGYDGGGGSGYTNYGNTDTPTEIDGSPVIGAPVPVVTGEDTETQSAIPVDVGITTSPEGETTLPGSTGGELATLFVEEGTIDVFDANGKKVDTYAKGKYSIYEYKYDENGNPIAARISPDGEEEKWINLENTNDSIYTVDKGQKVNFVLDENGIPVYDENGNQKGTVDKANYKVYEVKYDGNGNPIAVRISPDGEEEKWLHIDAGKTNGYFYENGQKGNYFLRDGELSIYDENGNIVGTATSGNFTIYGTKLDAQGNIVAVKISRPGEEEKWLYINQNSTNGFYMGIGQKGTFSPEGQSLNIYDNKGNIIGTINDGNYSVYDVKYDTNGNVIAVRISPNGKEEQWIYTTDEKGNIIGSYKSIDQMMKLDDGKVIVTTTKKKNNSLKYLGILGFLSVALGTTYVVKRKINKQNEQTYDEYENTEEYNEEPLEPGEYNVYEFKKDENNNITDARISEDNAKEDLWVHF